MLRKGQFLNRRIIYDRLSRSLSLPASPSEAGLSKWRRFYRVDAFLPARTLRQTGDKLRHLILFLIRFYFPDNIKCVRSSGIAISGNAAQGLEPF